MCSGLGYDFESTSNTYRAIWHMDMETGNMRFSMHMKAVLSLGGRMVHLLWRREQTRSGGRQSYWARAGGLKVDESGYIRYVLDAWTSNDVRLLIAFCWECVFRVGL